MYWEQADIIRKYKISKVLGHTNHLNTQELDIIDFAKKYLSFVINAGLSESKKELVYLTTRRDYKEGNISVLEINDFSITYDVSYSESLNKFIQFLVNKHYDTFVSASILEKFDDDYETYTEYTFHYKLRLHEKKN